MRPSVVTTDGGPAYVKCLGNPQGAHALACEWIATSVARTLGLPTLDFGLLELDDEDVPFPGGRERPGPAFATREEDGRTWPGDEESLSRLSNSGGAAMRAVALPARPMRLSKALLRIGEGTERNVVAYVSPLCDRTLPAQALRSLRLALADANANHWDAAGDALALRERVVDRLRPAAPADYLLPTTVAEAGDVPAAVDEANREILAVHSAPAPIPE